MDRYGSGGAVMSAKSVKKAATKAKIKPKSKPAAKVKPKVKAKVNLKVKAKPVAKNNVRGNKKPVAKVVASSKKSAVKKAVKTMKKPVKSPKKPAMPVAKKAKLIRKAVVKAPVVKPVAKTVEIKSKHRQTILKSKSEIQITNKKVMEPMTEIVMAKPVQQSKSKAVKGVLKSHLSTMGVPPYQEQKGEEYMNTHQREHFAKILRLWKKELMEEVDRTVHHMQDDAANFPDPNDRATQEEEFSLELRARDRERKLIKKIDEALQQIENNEYGFCDVCGVEIGIRRLEARPTATLCIDCKTLDEIRERTHG